MRQKYFYVWIILSFIIYFGCCPEPKKEEKIENKYEKIKYSKTNPFRIIYKANEDFNFTEDIRGQNLFYFDINPKLPTFIFALWGDSSNYITDIRIYHVRDTTEYQHIKLEEEPYNFVVSVPKDADYFLPEDYNFDGYEDIMLINSWGSGGYFWTVWLYDTKTGMFKTNDFLIELGNPSLDEGSKELSLYDRNGNTDETTQVYRFFSGKYLLVREEWNRIEFEKEKTYRVYDVKKLVNGKLKLVKRKRQLLSTEP